MNEEIRLIPGTLLHDSPFQYRRTYSATARKELAHDIKAQGILSPLLVRERFPNGRDLPYDPVDGFEIVFGHRRKYSGLDAGLEDFPCVSRRMTDREAMRAQLSENMKRQDVHPIEEAEGFAALMNEHGLNADQVAEELSKSRSYIYGRLKLLQACKPVREACLAGEIGSEVALLIARLRTEKLQQKALGYIKGKYLSLGDGGTKSFRSIRDLLREKFTLALGKKDCMFDTSDALLLPDAGACTDCPKRIGNAPEFEDLASDHAAAWGRQLDGIPDSCSDPDCYDTKKKAHLRNAAAVLESSGKRVCAKRCWSRCAAQWPTPSGLPGILVKWRA